MACEIVVKIRSHILKESGKQKVLQARQLLVLMGLPQQLDPSSCITAEVQSCNCHRPERTMEQATVQGPPEPQLISSSIYGRCCHLPARISQHSSGPTGFQLLSQAPVTMPDSFSSHACCFRQACLQGLVDKQPSSLSSQGPQVFSYELPWY